MAVIPRAKEMRAHDIKLTTMSSGTIKNYHDNDRENQNARPRGGGKGVGNFDGRKVEG